MRSFELRALSTHGTEGNKFDREKWRAQLNPVLEVWQQLTSTTVGIVSKKSRETMIGGKDAAEKRSKDPVDDFVNMENELAGDLCAMVETSLSMLRKVLFGSGLLTPFIQSIAMSLLSGIVPNEWTKRWDKGPEKPQAWLRELVRKRVSLGKWKASSAKGRSKRSPSRKSAPGLRAWFPKPYLP